MDEWKKKGTEALLLRNRGVINQSRDSSPLPFLLSFASRASSALTASSSALRFRSFQSLHRFRSFRSV